MTKYRFDWKDVIHGSIEIEANCGKDAEEILMNMSLKDLLKNSQQTKMNERYALPMLASIFKVLIRMIGKNSSLTCSQ